MPQSARLSEGGGVQSLYGQCPNRPGIFQTGASLKALGKKTNKKPTKTYLLVVKVGVSGLEATHAVAGRGC